MFQRLKIGEVSIASSQYDDDCDTDKVLFSFWSEVDVVDILLLGFSWVFLLLFRLSGRLPF
jgi:hypothetical protein